MTARITSIPVFTLIVIFQKWKIMKPTARLFLLSVLLAACAKATLPTDATVISKATVAFTSAPTEKPKTPTATPDPNTPVGYTRFENGIFYLDNIENGRTIAYIWTVKTDAKTNKIILAEWVKQITDSQGIPLLDWGDSQKVAGIINVYVSLSADGGVGVLTLRHVRKTAQDKNDIDLSSGAKLDIYKRVNNKLPGEAALDSFDWELTSNQGAPIYFFVDKPANSFTWHLNQTQGADVFVVNWDSLEGASEFTDPFGTKFRSKILGVDNHGNVVGLIAADAPLNTLKLDQWWVITLSHSASLIERENQTVQQYTSLLTEWISLADNKNPRTWIEQVPNK